ncbi:hypothetical protein CF165_42515 [Amycolatopsis vastitatis]|uniref:Uncharacterized protein n=1 Tax=Amycolatopsis vastitatis TaxID=1905142 RepID=A0A229SNA1_9PSEU|nr:hypothetical protein CF165_42515 [Amycolatopsis vastitatis]
MEDLVPLVVVLDVQAVLGTQTVEILVQSALVAAERPDEIFRCGTGLGAGEQFRDKALSGGPLKGAFLVISDEPHLAVEEFDTGDVHVDSQRSEVVSHWSSLTGPSL